MYYKMTMYFFFLIFFILVNTIKVRKLIDNFEWWIVWPENFCSSNTQLNYFLWTFIIFISIKHSIIVILLTNFNKVLNFNPVEKFFEKLPTPKENFFLEVTRDMISFKLAGEVFNWLHFTIVYCRHGKKHCFKFKNNNNQLI